MWQQQFSSSSSETMTGQPPPSSTDIEERGLSSQLKIPSSPAVQAIDSTDKLVLDNVDNNNGGDVTSFEELMRERNRLRKEREELNVAELKVQISRLEDALAAETRRRVDATTKLDSMAREEVYEMEKRLRKQLEQDNEQIFVRLQKIESRLEELELRWQKDSTSISDQIQNKSTELRNNLEQIQQEQDVERKSRLKREGKLLEQIESHQKEFEDRWNVERKNRIESIAKLEDKIDNSESNRIDEQADFQRRAELELDSLRRELDEETIERQQQDDEIVAALNRYTQQLQHSLSILSSD